MSISFGNANSRHFRPEQSCAFPLFSYPPFYVCSWMIAFPFLKKQNAILVSLIKKGVLIQAGGSAAKQNLYCDMKDTSTFWVRAILSTAGMLCLWAIRKSTRFGLNKNANATRRNWHTSRERLLCLCRILMWFPIDCCMDKWLKSSLKAWRKLFAILCAIYFQIRVVFWISCSLLLYSSLVSFPLFDKLKTKILQEAVLPWSAKVIAHT